MHSSIYLCFPPHSETFESNGAKTSVPTTNFLESKTNLSTQIMSTVTEALGEFFASLPPSPAWAPFWSSLFEGALSALSVWLFALLGFKSVYSMQLICSLALHFAFFLIAISFGCRDGWQKEDTTECFGRMIVVAMFGMYIYQYFYGHRPTRMFLLGKRTA